MNNNLETTIAKYNDLDYTVKTIVKEFAEELKTDASIKDLKDKSEVERDSAAASIVLAYIGHLNGKTISDNVLLGEARRITHNELEMGMINRDEYYHIESVVSDVETRIAQFRAAYESETRMLAAFSGIDNPAVQKKLKAVEEEASATFMYALQMYVYAKERGADFVGKDYFMIHITTKLGADANKNNN